MVTKRQILEADLDGLLEILEPIGFIYYESDSEEYVRHAALHFFGFEDDIFISAEKARKMANPWRKLLGMGRRMSVQHV